MMLGGLEANCGVLNTKWGVEGSDGDVGSGSGPETRGFGPKMLLAGRGCEQSTPKRCRFCFQNGAFFFPFTIA